MAERIENERRIVRMAERIEKERRAHVESSATDHDSGAHRERAPDLALYIGSFDPASPFTNFDFDASLTSGHFVGEDTFLTAGTTYIVVDSGVTLADFGPFSTIITGPTGAQLTPLPSAVPEPSALILLVTTLLAAAFVGRKRRSPGLRQVNGPDLLNFVRHILRFRSIQE